MPITLKYVDANTLQLFPAKMPDGKWLRDDSVAAHDLMSGRIHDDIKAMIADSKILRPACRIRDELSAKKTGWKWSLPWSPITPKIKTKQIHVLVKVPDMMTGTLPLCGVAPEAQWRLWQSIVRVASGTYSGTALVLHRSSRYLYLLTNLHFWLAEYDEEEIFFEHMSASFMKDVELYLKRNPNKKRSLEKRKSDGGGLPLISDESPLVLVEQLLPGHTTLTEVHYFFFHSGVCWCSSANYAYAIVKVPVPPPRIRLLGGKRPSLFNPPMRCYVFGFYDNRKKKKTGQSYAIVPVRFTGYLGFTRLISSLSTVDLPASGFVCTRTGVPIGYLTGSTVDDESGNKLYQWHDLAFNDMPDEYYDWPDDDL
ncbi:hypothetical protein DVH05_006275 [Phytophthora capsici]|nr:hypothetical protein DVH05_006275 [Phytophthora capsici]